jgi:hypothetical protein
VRGQLRNIESQVRTLQLIAKGLITEFEYDKLISLSLFFGMLVDGAEVKVSGAKEGRPSH